MRKQPARAGADDNAATRHARQPAKTPGMALPHERDESTQAAQPRQPSMRQAQRDQASGQVDTDNYTRIRETRAAAERGGVPPAVPPAVPGQSKSSRRR